MERKQQKVTMHFILLPSKSTSTTNAIRNPHKKKQQIAQPLPEVKQILPLIFIVPGMLLEPFLLLEIIILHFSPDDPSTHFVVRKTGISFGVLVFIQEDVKDSN